MYSSFIYIISELKYKKLVILYILHVFNPIHLYIWFINQFRYFFKVHNPLYKSHKTTMWPFWYFSSNTSLNSCHSNFIIVFGYSHRVLTNCAALKDKPMSQSIIFLMMFSDRNPLWHWRHFVSARRILHKLMVDLTKRKWLWFVLLRFFFFIFKRSLRMSAWNSRTHIPSKNPQRNKSFSRTSLVNIFAHPPPPKLRIQITLQHKHTSKGARPEFAAFKMNQNWLPSLCWWNISSLARLIDASPDKWHAMTSQSISLRIAHRAGSTTMMVTLPPGTVEEQKKGGKKAKTKEWFFYGGHQEQSAPKKRFVYLDLCIWQGTDRIKVCFGWWENGLSEFQSLPGNIIE